MDAHTAIIIHSTSSLKPSYGIGPTSWLSKKKEFYFLQEK